MPTKSPPHPGLSVRLNCLEPFGLSITEGAKVLGVSRTTLSRLINGQAGVSADMALRLAKAFGATPDIWIGMQGAYDLAQALKHEDEIKVIPHRSGMATLDLSRLVDEEAEVWITDFDQDLHRFVIANYQRTLGAIDDLVSSTEREYADDDPEYASSVMSEVEDSCDRQREAARELAVVALVIRFHCWIENLHITLQKATPEQSDEKSSRNRNSRLPKLIKLLNQLNQKLGEVPEEISFFCKLVSVRDSVVHANSKAEWEYKEKREVAKEYTDGERVWLTSVQINEAIDKTRRQMNWYLERMDSTTRF